MPAKKASAEFFARPLSTDDSNETVAKAAPMRDFMHAVIRSPLPLNLSIQFLDRFQFREN